MKSLRHLLGASMAGLLVACGGGSTGTVSLKLTDAPGDFEAAVVTISEIDLVGSGGTMVLSNTKVTTDLLKLANDTATLVDKAVVSSGKYTQLRFVITGAYVQLAQGGAIYASSPTYEGLPAGAQVAGALQMPSFGESGLKVDLPDGGVTVGTDSKVLLVDFDVGQSFGHPAGNSGAWVMHPVVKATEFELSGNVDVTLTLAAGVTLPAGTSAVLTSTTDSTMSPKSVALTNAGSAYTASFLFLFPGDYALTFATTSSGVTLATTPALPASVTVASGQLTTVSATVTSVSVP